MNVSIPAQALTAFSAFFSTKMENVGNVLDQIEPKAMGSVIRSSQLQFMRGLENNSSDSFTQL